MAYLKADKASTKISCKYINFENIFLLKLIMELLDHTSINNYVIELVNDWQPFYGPIYNLNPMKLEILKIYMENNLANNFIKSSKSVTGSLIFFDKKPNKSLRLYVDYQDLHNLTIKNRYLLSFMRKLLD